VLQVAEFFETKGTGRKQTLKLLTMCIEK
jgi:hypothetical protein